MDERMIVRRSRLLSKTLRHQPSLAGLTLGPGGWVAVDDLLRGLSEHAGAHHHPRGARRDRGEQQ